MNINGVNYAVSHECALQLSCVSNLYMRMNISVLKIHNNIINHLFCILYRVVSLFCGIGNASSGIMTIIHTLLKIK